MDVKIYLILSVILTCEGVINDLNDEVYDRMPEIFALDNYDACMRRTDGLYCLISLELNSDSSNPLFQQIKAYSEHRVKHYNHTYLDRGVCVPKTCKRYSNYTNLNEEDLVSVIEECLNKTLYNDYKLNASVLKIHYCDKNTDKTNSDYLDWIAATAFVTVLSLNIIGSILDKFYSKDSDAHILTSFSVFRNWRNLTKDYKERSKTVSLRSLAGLRILVLFSVIASHMIYCVSAFGDRVHDFERLHYNPIYQIFMYGFNIVQISFAMSGFLLSYKLVEYEEVSAISWIDIPKILIGRFIRLTPSYGFVLLLFISWMKYTGPGPLWSMFIGGNIRACHEYYWYHIFYMNNYIFEDTCFLPMWYVAADVQVFIVGVVAICITKKRRVLVLATLHVLGFLGPIVDILLRGVLPVAIVTPEFLRAFDNDTFRLSHIRGHNNLPCFMTGAITGIFVFRWQKKGYKIQNKMLHHTSNLLPIALIAVFLSTELLHADGQEPALLTKLVFAVAFRLALCAIMAFGLIAIVMKFDGPLCRLLAWSGWVVPSRLSYSVYIIHTVIMFLLMGLRTTRENLSFIHFITTYIGVTVISFLLATMLYIMVEVPFSKFIDRTSINREYMKKINFKSE